MVMEIEKMTVVQAKAEPAEAEEINHIINTLSSDFETMIRDSRNFILTGEKRNREWNKSISALKRMKIFGDKYGVEFPKVTTNEEAAVYILQFGKEVTTRR